MASMASPTPADAGDIEPSSTPINFDRGYATSHQAPTFSPSITGKPARVPAFSVSSFLSSNLTGPLTKFAEAEKNPDYLGVQKNPPSLALCPATKNCISTSENVSDRAHYAPPWNYNRGRKKPVSREEAMEELLEVVTTYNMPCIYKPDNFTPRIVEKKDEYLRVEYESRILGLVDDVEFWFPPAKNSIAEYRSASRLGNYDFDVNRKRIKALRQELEKKGWGSEDNF